LTFNPVTLVNVKTNAIPRSTPVPNQPACKP
jgi:hypothetical protein